MPRLNAQGTFELREERLLGEFLARFFPRDRIIRHVRLGQTPFQHSGVELTPSDRALLRGVGRWADALIIRPTDLILVEAEILPSPGSVSELQLYGRLLRRDDHFEAFSNMPLRMMLVWAFDEPVLAQLARDAGIEVRVFSPQWVAEALRARFPSSPRARRPTPTPPLDGDPSVKR